jgi:exosome complex component RRP41
LATKNPPIPLLREDGRRISGRSATDLRDLSMSVGVLDKAAGSAMVQWGRNKVLSAVYGPREVVPKHLTDNLKARVTVRYIMTPFSSLEEHGRAGPNRRSIEISKVIRHIFENVILVNQFPKTQIEISTEVLQSDGGTRVSALTAASLALVDAGLPVKDLVSGVSIGKIAGQMVVDLDKDEDNFGESDMPMAFSLRTGEVLLFQMDGMLTREELAKGVDMAYEAAMKVRTKQVEALMAKYQAAATAENNSAEGA